MLLKKGQIPIFIFNLIYLAIALFIFIGKKNYEFIGYIGVIVLLLVVILATNKKVNYPNFVLWGLSFWGLLHMAGGGVVVKGEILYKLILIPISQSYEIFKYDQFVHIVGFSVATLLMWVLIKPLLKKDFKMGASLFIVIIMAGLGVGALNEIIEFTATVLVPETNVGGYANTSLDLVADLVGALIAMVYIRKKNGEI